MRFSSRRLALVLLFPCRVELFTDTADGIWLYDFMECRSSKELVDYRLSIPSERDSKSLPSTMHHFYLSSPRHRTQAQTKKNFHPLQQDCKYWTFFPQIFHLLFDLVLPEFIFGSEKYEIQSNYSGSFVRTFLFF